MYGNVKPSGSYGHWLAGLLAVYLICWFVSSGTVRVDLSRALELPLQATDSPAPFSGQWLLRYQYDPGRVSGVFDQHLHGFSAQLLLLTVAVLLAGIGVTVASVVVAFAAAAITALYWFSAPAVDEISYRGCLLWLLTLYLSALVFRLVIWLRSRWRISAAVQRYAPSQLTRHYYQNPGEVKEIGAAQPLTIMFVDMRDFTSITEKLDPERLGDWLNLYLNVVSRVVERHNGTVDKFMGDSVMAFWGAPVISERHAQDALQAGVEIVKALDDLSADLKRQGLPPIRVGVGICTGKASVGNLGSESRMTYTAIGDAVNTADRLQKVTRDYQTPLIVNDELIRQVPDYLFREIDWVEVKGRKRKVHISQPLCHERDATATTYQQLQLHRKGWEMTRTGDLPSAIKVFSDLAGRTGDEEFYQAFVERLQTQIAERKQNRSVAGEATGAASVESVQQRSSS